MPNKADRPFNSRRYQGQIEKELILGGILITLVVGGGLIALIWGPTAFFVALGCFGGAGGLICVIWLLLKVIEIVSRS